MDVAKASGMVCTRVPHPPGRDAADPGLGGERDHGRGPGAGGAPGGRGDRDGHPGVDVGLLADLVHLLEAAGLDVQLVNARDVRNVPGRPRRTSPTRSGWRSCRAGHAAAESSSRPRRSASCGTSRLRTGLTRDRTRYWARLEKLLEEP